MKQSKKKKYELNNIFKNKIKIYKNFKERIVKRKNYDASISEVAWRFKGESNIFLFFKIKKIKFKIVLGLDGWDGLYVKWKQNFAFSQFSDSKFSKGSWKKALLGIVGKENLD